MCTCQGLPGSCPLDAAESWLSPDQGQKEGRISSVGTGQGIEHEASELVPLLAKYYQFKLQELIN